MAEGLLVADVEVGIAALVPNTSWPWIAASFSVVVAKAMMTFCCAFWAAQ